MASSPIYDTLGQGYSARRREDPRIAAAIYAALGDARHVLNVGAGTGSYEPVDRPVVALDPSATMLRQRQATAAPVVQGCAESLPFADGAFDAVMGVLTLHHWTDQSLALRECARVARTRLVFFTWDPADAGFWLTQDYFPHFLEWDRRRFPSVEMLVRETGRPGRVVVDRVPVPRDCVDGFLGAHWARPDAYVTETMRSFSCHFTGAESATGLARLEADLADGSWARRYGHLLNHAALDIGYRVVRIEFEHTSVARGA